MKIRFLLLLSLSFTAPLAYPQAVSQPQAANLNQASAASIIPRYVRFSGTAADSVGTTTSATLALYSDQTGGNPLWLETQNVSVDANGHYSVLLGAATKDGIPADLFASGEARWLGVKMGDAPEQARVLLVSVPYALKAGDAETLGGKPLSAFLLASQSSTETASAGTTSGSERTAQSRLLTGATGSPATASGSLNYIAKFDATGTNIINSSIFDNGNIGIGTSNPLARLQVDGVVGEAFRMTATGANATALRLRNSGGDSYFGVESGTAGAYFPDSLPFSTVIYSPGQPIQNIIGSSAKMTILSNGNVGIGSANPLARLQVDGVVGEAFRMTATGANATALRLRNSGGDSYFGVESGTAGAYFPGSLAFGTVIYSPGQPIQNIIGSSSKMTILGNGNVGIGTSAPTNPLTVGGIIQSTSGGFMFPDGTLMSSPSMLTNSVNYSGTTTNQILYAIQNQVGTGSAFSADGVPSGLRGDSTTTTGYAAGVFGSASSPVAPGVAGVNVSTCPQSGTCNGYGVFGWSVNATKGVGVWGQAEATSSADNVGVYGQAKGDDGTGVFGYASSTAQTSSTPTGVFGLVDNTNGNGVWGRATATSGATVGVYGQIGSSSGVAGLFDAPANGTILEGRVGNIPPIGQQGSYTKVFHVDAAGNFYGHTFNPGGADFAEAVDAIGGGSKYEPGDVMMIDETGTRRLALANGAYSTKVAGIYSTQPGVLATNHPMDDPRIAKEVPLAIVGIVPCKVSAENGAIHAGDLLVTASIPGYAMKGTDRGKMLGAIVGKALGSLDKGTGTIEVLVSLH